MVDQVPVDNAFRKSGSIKQLTNQKLLVVTSVPNFDEKFLSGILQFTLNIFFYELSWLASEILISFSLKLL